MAIDGADDDGADAADEEAFVELAEYVRVGVLLVNEELKPVTPVSPSRPSSVPASPGAPGGAGPHRVH